jgi:hypothetical protein
MNDWNWGGARWWRCDLHTHTPASDDYGKGPDQAKLKARSPREWLLDYMRAEIDCVAVTDHNNGAWVDPLKEAVADLEAEEPEGFRPLYLFPGVEISVNGGVHLLAILPPEKMTADIAAVLGAVGYEGTRGKCDGITTRSFPEVAETIRNHGGLAIPAHVDRDNGLFRVLESGETLKRALSSESIVAMELCDPGFEKPTVYKQLNPGWTEVLGSDAHHPSGASGQRFPGSHFSWIKMGSPSIEGLRLALMDGPLSVLRSDEGRDDPNSHGARVLEAVEVSGAHYMGQRKPFVVSFNPWLNAIVGGRGTGKSTVVEFMRLALRREEDLPDELGDEFAKYRSVYPEEGPGGLLRRGTTIRLVYRKEGSRFRVQWSPGGELDPIQADGLEEWTRAEGDVRRRFPVRLFSQKQIFHLATRPRALLNVVDEAPEVGRASWRERMDEVGAQFLSLRARAREIEAGLAEEGALKGELDDVKRKLAVFEEMGHAEVLREFQRRRRQGRAVEVWEEGWGEAGDRIREVAEALSPEVLDATGFDLESEEDAELHELADQARRDLDSVRQELTSLATRADELRGEWLKAKEASRWRQRVREAEAAYQELRDRLSAEGEADPTTYAEQVQRRQAIEQRLSDLEDRRSQVAGLRKQAGERLNQLLELRRGLTESRKLFLASVLDDNRFVRITVEPYGAQESVEREFRERVRKEDGAFRSDIGTPDGGGLLGSLYAVEDQGEGKEKLSRSEVVEQALAGLKKAVRDIAEGKHAPGTLSDQRFATHLERLQPEDLDRVDLWSPEDSLKVEYSPTGDGREFRPIEEGSPGQKTAALLAFLLSHGDEPLILDQPEDDLDNHLIYELIVTQLREVKRRRQVIVVTHNANIVVNGDAELVVALAARGGETQKECEGSLQERLVRDTICDVMEGGRKAFDERYRRIALEGRRV